jgi:hypothetical protein
LAQVRVKQAQTDYIMDLDDISLSGARMHLGSLKRPSWLAVDRVVEIGIIHPLELDTVELEGRIVRVTEDLEGTSVAVFFVELDDHARDGIARLVETARGQSEAPPGSAAPRRPPPLPES